jgi:hypothetical protein
LDAFEARLAFELAFVLAGLDPSVHAVLAGAKSVPVLARHEVRRLDRRGTNPNHGGTARRADRDVKARAT